MRRPLLGLRGLWRTATGRKLLRYFVASAVNVVVAETILAFAFGVLRWPARSSAVLAAVVAALPAYWLARRWVWGRSGRSHLVKEVLPFWALALLALVVNTWVAGVAEEVGAEAGGSRLEQTALVTGSVLIASAGLWVVRFLLLNHVLFADRVTPSAVDGHRGDRPAEPPSGTEIGRRVG